PAMPYGPSPGPGWLGTGWRLDLPSVDIDTRWGVPRYDGSDPNNLIDPVKAPNGYETETYMLNGAQLAPVANRGGLVPRTAEKSFSQRVEGEFLRIVRHGNSPSTYWWEGTAKDGTRPLYGRPAVAGPAEPPTGPCCPRQ